MVLCSGDYCSKKDTCMRYAKNGKWEGVHQVETFATFGSGSVGIDASGNSYSNIEYSCGPNGKYKMYVPIEGTNE